MGLVAGLDVGAAEVRAWVADPNAPDRVLSSVSRPLVPGLEVACREALTGAVEKAGRPGQDYLGITVCADRHDWLVSRLSGVRVTELSQACAAGLVDVPRRTWAPSVRAGTRTVPLVEAGTAVGELREGWALPTTLPVVSGCSRNQLAAMGAGGMADGVVTVVGATGGGTGRVQATTAEPGLWDGEGVRLLTSAGPALWAVEGLECGPGGRVRASVERLERAVGQPASAVVVWAPNGTDVLFARRVADALGREVRPARCNDPVATAGTVLVARAVGAHAHLPHLPPPADAR